MRGSDRTVDYVTLAELRYRIRRFLRVRETVTRRAGIAPQQYLVLLQLKGLDGVGPATIGALAERLQIQHHSAVGLVDRLVRRGLVRRRRDDSDRRIVVVELRSAGERLLRRLAIASLDDLRTEGPPLIAVLKRLVAGTTHRRRRAPARKRTSPTQ